MSRRVLVLRPEPGARETAARAAAFGLDPVVAPLFEVAPAPWEPPNALPEAVLLTSANAARNGGEGLRNLVNLPCYCVGEATAAAAGEVGFRDILTGPSDGAAALAMMAADGIRSVLHLCGRDHLPLEHPDMRIERRLVYAADGAGALPEAAEAALAEGALVLLHSPRAAAHFASLVADRSGVRLAAISPAAAAAAGEGWALKAVAPAPRDQPLLELAAKLCNIDPFPRRDPVDEHGL